MTESGLEMRSNPPQNSSISLPLAPKLFLEITFYSLR